MRRVREPWRAVRRLESLVLSYSGRIAMFLYDSPKDAGRELPLSGTAFPATEAVKAVCVPPLDSALLAELSHEANHVIIIDGLGPPGTNFMSEGLASALQSERYHHLCDAVGFRKQGRGVEAPPLINQRSRRFLTN